MDHDEVTRMLSELLDAAGDVSRDASADEYAAFHEPLPSYPTPGDVARLLEKRLEGSRSVRHPDRWNVWVTAEYMSSKPAAETLDLAGMDDDSREALRAIIAERPTAAYFHCVSVYTVCPWGTPRNITGLLAALQAANPRRAGNTSMEVVTLSEPEDSMTNDVRVAHRRRLRDALAGEVRDRVLVPLLSLVLGQEYTRAEIERRLSVNMVA